MASALSHIKVLDLSWVAAGPLTGTTLAYFGATVIKCESAVRVDLGRGSPPTVGKRRGVNLSGYFGALNMGKLGVALDFNNPRGLEVLQRLAGWSDVIIEAFTAGTMQKWGLDWESLRARKPGTILCSMSLQGQTGPQASSRGFGLQVQGMCGLADMIGWPDGDPTGSTHAYTDYCMPFWAVFAIASALDYRDRTGRGQHLDLSQMEATINMTGTAIPDYLVNGRVERRVGNRLLGGDGVRAAPHGTYPVAGDDRWIAIGVFDQGEWEALCRVLGHHEWTRDPLFATHLERGKNDAALDALIAEATRSRDGLELQARLQEAGVSAGMVHDQRGLFEDAQLNHRGHFVPIHHTEWGEYPGEQYGARPSLTPPVIQRASPCLGEHNEQVLKDLLGYSDEEYLDLVTAGAVEFYGGD